MSRSKKKPAVVTVSNQFLESMGVERVFLEFDTFLCDFVTYTSLVTKGHQFSFDCPLHIILYFRSWEAKIVICSTTSKY